MLYSVGAIITGSTPHHCFTACLTGCALHDVDNNIDVASGCLFACCGLFTCAGPVIAKSARIGYNNLPAPPVEQVILLSEF
jgi:hypothetical protein